MLLDARRELLVSSNKFALLQIAAADDQPDALGLYTVQACLAPGFMDRDERHMPTQ